MPRDSVVSIATRYGLDGLEIESRRGEVFRTHPHRSLDPHCPLYNGYRVSFLRVKRSGRGPGHPPPSSAEVKNSRAIPVLLIWDFVAGSRVNFTFMPMSSTWSFQVFLLKPCKKFFPLLSIMLYSPPISSFWTWAPNDICWVKIVKLLSV
jgi:hypothetical protein